MKERDKSAAYYECRQMIENTKNIRSLAKVVEQVMATARQHKFDDIHLEKLEQVGMRKYEQFNREMQAMVRNRKY